MCGLICWLGRQRTDAAPQSIGEALLRMRRRGPDGQGEWAEPGVRLGHRRLAVLDLDPRAQQPMHSMCGRYVIVFNGEIYNFRTLRRELEVEGSRFATSSDTEVILALFAREGEAMLPRLQGMFAFVIWDREAKRAFAARDPYGIKPLYVAKAGDSLLIGSQVKALLATGLVSRAPCARGQAGFWMLGSVPEPHTWYRDIRALPAGHCAWIQDGRVRQERQWDDIGAIWRGADDATLETTQSVREAVREALRESVRRHLVSDVPVGVFLSGGVDSGSLAGLMVEMGGDHIEGFTLAYDEFVGSADNEAPLAKTLAKHYGINHSVRRVTRDEFRSDLPRILDALDQPTIDGVNTWYASKAVAERGLKVAISGVGGDELFHGYSHFRSLPRLLRARQLVSGVPGMTVLLRSLGSWQSARTGNLRWVHLEGWTRTIEGAWWLRRSIFSPEQLPSLMGADLAREAFAEFDVVSEVRAMTGALPKNPTLALAQIESTTYLRNQLLRDSDWASMDHSVELRTPLVDAHLMVQLQALLPQFHRYRGKRLLAESPEKHLPEAIIRRQKTGFGIPLAQWVSGQNLSLAKTWAPKVAAAYSST